MAFDLGGFFGGIIGVLGAYGVAIYQIKKQREADKPSSSRKIYELCEEVEEVLKNGWYEVQLQNADYSGLFRDTFNLGMDLRKKIPLAMETDSRIYKIIEDIVKELEELGVQNLSQSNNQVQMVIFRDQIVMCVDNASERLNIIRDQVLEDIRRLAKLKNT
ncbi:hypothetical protein ACFWMP_13825 [Paenibacillus sp. NPDC058367]|uniref:hypothetical protein n=1 Tax=Paenibacillus sp. NPDC058367 TaxID=3346460 RepID=UPI00365792F8